MLRQHEVPYQNSHKFHNYAFTDTLNLFNTVFTIKLNLWTGTPKNQVRLKQLLPDNTTGGLVVSKALSLNLSFSFPHWFLLLLI